MRPDPKGTSDRGGLFHREDSQIYSVTDFTRLVKGVLEGKFPNVAVCGEISNLTRASSGHIYFTIKDAGAQLRCTMWRPVAAKLTFKLEEGQEVVVTGGLNVYEPRGDYSLNVRRVELKGAGALQIQFEKLKAKLEAEGLFSAERKRELPFLPQAVGIVTSPTGAAVRDMLRVLRQRFPGMPVILHPAKVQGEGAAQEIAAAIDVMNKRYSGSIDVLIVGRGGGSIEDLWAFNEEAVARAIYRSSIPVISAVGHETDFTIADFVADVRAATPTHAAQMAVPDKEELLLQLKRNRQRLKNGLLMLCEHNRTKLKAIEQSYGFRRPLEMVQESRRALDDLYASMMERLRYSMQTMKHSVRHVAGRLDELSPLRVLARGYSVTLNSEGRALRSATEAKHGDEIRTRLQQGTLVSRVVGHSQKSLF